MHEYSLKPKVNGGLLRFKAGGTTNSFSNKLKNFSNNDMAEGVGQAADAVNNIVSSFSKDTTQGPNGDLRSGIDLGWNAISDAASNFGPWGKAASAAMKAVGALNSILGAIFGATDNMTKGDAILDSPLGFLTGVGWINQAFGDTSDTITKDEEAFELVGASYGGTGNVVDDALTKSGKKYGLFSGSAREEANREIAKAKRQQSMMTDIASEALTRNALMSSMSAINGNRRNFAMLGGYDLASVRAARHGLSLKTIMTAKRIVSGLKFLQGGKVIDPFELYLSTLPESLRDSTNFRVKDYWKFNGSPKDFNEAVSKGMFTQLPDGWYANSVAENPATGEIEFMKSSTHPSHHMEIDWYNSDDAAEFRSKYELLKTEPYWKYVKRKPLDNATSSFKEGGILEVSLDNVSEEHLEEYILEEVLLEQVVPELKDGGTVNVIPAGALHARLHHMENADNLTKKGIPVVAEKENGELELLAEIEREELIIRLEVTKKLEELMKEYSKDDSSLKEKDEVAIEAGKLLVKEILNNTIDNTNNLL